MSQRESRSEARRHVGGDGGRRGNSGSRRVDWQKQRVGSVHQLQQATGRMAVIELVDVPVTVLGAKNRRNADRCSHGRDDVDWTVDESATKSADKQSASRAGSAR